MSDTQIKGRPLYALIDRKAFLHNIERVESLCPDAQALVVIKADGYGHGLLHVAQAAGARDLAVACSNEAAQLIEAGVENRIWVLEGPLSDTCFGLTSNHSMVWVIHSEWQIELIKSQSQNVNVFLKIDTGMHRLGFLPENLSPVLEKLAALPNVNVQGVMTHLASSDQKEHVSVRAQLDRFKFCLDEYCLNDKERSIANSGGILNYPASRIGWVRPGIMLYGAMPDPEQGRVEPDLQPVMQLRSKVIALNSVRSGESVGYSAQWKAERDSKIAVIACGYGDGYPRHAVNGTPVWVEGRIAPLVGRVSMDMITVDVTELPDVAIGSEVELWGKHVSIDQVAFMAGTISYEILTQVTKRVPRVYTSY